MAFIDIVLLVIVGAFVLFGLFFGLIHTLGSLIGAIVGIIFASRLIDPSFEAIGFLFGGGNIARVVLFILIFLIVTRLVGLVFWLVGRVAKPLSWIPFVKSINHLLGGVLGFVEGVIVVGIVLLYATQIIPFESLRSQVEDSRVGNYLVTTAEVLQFFFPEDWRQAIESVADSTAEVIPEPPTEEDEATE